MKQSDTVGGLILIPLTLSALFCHLQSEICRAERKVCLFGFVCFFVFASVPACLACHFSGALCCCCCFVLFFSSGVVCFISQAIWLVSEPNFAPVSPCIPPHPPSQKDILTFTYFPKLTHRLHTPNKSILHLPQLERHMAHSSPENVQAVVSVPCPQWLEESGPRFSYLSLSVCCFLPVGLRGDGGRRWRV